MIVDTMRQVAMTANEAGDPLVAYHAMGVAAKADMIQAHAAAKVLEGISSDQELHRYLLSKNAYPGIMAAAKRGGVSFETFAPKQMPSSRPGRARPETDTGLEDDQSDDFTM